MECQLPLNNSLNNLFGEIPNLFKSEAELRELWSNPLTRKTLLEKLDQQVMVRRAEWAKKTY